MRAWWPALRRRFRRRPAAAATGSDSRAWDSANLPKGARLCKLRSAHKRRSVPMKLVIHPAVEAERLGKIARAASPMEVVNAGSEDDAVREIADAEAFFGKITPRLLAAARRLRWVQAPTASLEHYVFPSLVRHPCVLTNMRGLFSDVIADQVLGYLICFARNLHRYVLQQARGEWAPIGGE